MPAAPTRVDWFRILDDLKREGYGLREIAHFTHIPRTNLHRYRCGAEPMYSNGDRLIGFWAQVTEKNRDDVPMVNPYSYRA